MFARLRILTGYAPLLPAAFAATLGIVFDRYLSVPIPAAMIVVVVSLILSILLLRTRSADMSRLPQWLAVTAIAAAYHHAVRDVYPADDIGYLADHEALLVRGRAVVVEEPVVRPGRTDPLLSRPRTESTSAVIRLVSLDDDRTKRASSGLAILEVDGVLRGILPGDTIEFTGWLSAIPPAMNPGETDFARRNRDRRIRAEIHVRHDADAVVLIEQGWRHSFSGWLAALRGWGERVLGRTLPPGNVGIASALLLGDTSAMSREEWQVYVHTGVVHVLAISGQHLVVLGVFLWYLLLVCGLSYRQAAVATALILVLYALLTGGRPSAMRAAIMVSAVCGGLLLQRRSPPANTFALAWLGVLFLNPTDLFTAGFQLSFLCVAMLIWAIPRWFPAHVMTPLEELIDESRPLPVRFLRRAGRLIGRWYLVTLVLMLATLPLVAVWQNVISPVGILIGPPAIVLTSIALIAGFIIFPLSLLGSWATWLPACITAWSLDLCDAMVHAAERLPFGSVHVPTIPMWWVVGCYGVLVAALLIVERVPTLGFRPILRPTAVGMMIAGWATVGLLAGAMRPMQPGLRVTVLAVGHGGCIVLETGDGRVILYDAGSLAGPDVARRQIAPYLWSRGIVRIDEVFISHGDLDHFNALPALAERFTIGQVSWTPSFSEKPTPGVAHAIARLRELHVPVRVVRAGDKFPMGDALLTVLHPPPQGPAGNENARSLVMLVEQHGWRLLLTGDLEQQGLQQVLDTPPLSVDVLLAPHHGSRTANTQRLVEWSQPLLAIASDGYPIVPRAGDDVYSRNGIPIWYTWPEGAVTIRLMPGELSAETFRSRKLMKLQAPLQVIR